MAPQIDETERLMHAEIDSPLGALTVVASPVGVRSLMWPNDGSAPEPVDTASSDAGSVIAQVRQQLGEYFAGTRQSFDVPLDPVGTNFQQQAWQALRSIPFGETRSYGEQAAQMGDKRKARAVGAANGRNPIGIIVPCHRVIGSNGSLTGFAGGIDAKRFLLEHEQRVSGRTLDL